MKVNMLNGAALCSKICHSYLDLERNVSRTKGHNLARVSMQNISLAELATPEAITEGESESKL